MPGYSLRTFLLSVGGMAVICGLFTSGGLTADFFHLCFALAFAIPGCSYGYDLRRSSRGAAIGVCAAAVIGCAGISAVVLALEFGVVLLAR